MTLRGLKGIFLKKTHPKIKNKKANKAKAKVDFIFFLYIIILFFPF
jgi:hypothetical protein